MTIIACPQCGAKNRVDERSGTLQPICGRCGTRLPAAEGDTKPVIITDSSFELSVLNEARLVLLDCWAPWCGPCRLLTPIIDQLAAEAAGRYVVAKLNTDENPAVSAQFRIDSIPTVLLFKSGKLVDRVVGLQNKTALQAKIRALA